MDLTVITCTHNPRIEYLEEVIQGLKRQTLPRERWEYLLVDNASSPQRIPKPDLTWHEKARIVREDILGLTPARLRAVREAQGEVLVFVDDDNVLEADFLLEAWRAAKEKPFLGSWSGQCQPRFEEEPPAWTRRYWGNLVIREFTTDVWSNLPRLPATMPCGAGLCVRRSVARHYLGLHETGQRRFQLDRTGDILLSGGDNDLAACACDLAMGVGLLVKLKLTHLIPRERLTVQYLSALIEGIQFSSTLLDAERGIQLLEEKKFNRWINLVRLLRCRGPHRSIFRAGLSGQERARAVLSKRAITEPRKAILGISPTANNDRS